MQPVAGPNLADAPKDLLRYGSRFLSFPEIVRCREVCRVWKEVIDDPKHDHELFIKFTGNEKLGEDRPYFNATKAAYLTEIANNKEHDPHQMDYHAAPYAPAPRKCCQNCCGCNTDKIMVFALVLLACCTCCGCCCCTGRLPMM